VDYLAHPEWIDENRLRLVLYSGLAAFSLVLFRAAALPSLAVALAAAAAGLVAVNLLFHRVGIRAAGKLWPGVARGTATALLFFCLLPPGVPLPVVFALSLAATLIEGRVRQLSVPLAVNGALLAWLVAWTWHVRDGVGFIRPFDLRQLDEPVQLWVRFHRDLDPSRLYTGNVPGLLGVTSFGLVGICVVVLAYGRRASWPYILGFFAPIALLTALQAQPLPVYLVNGTALAFAGLVGADTRRLPLGSRWRAGAGLVAGGVAAFLLARQLGSEAYGFGVLVSSSGVALFQLFGLAGSPPLVAERAPAPQRRGSPLLLVTLVAFAPLGLALAWRDGSLAPRERTWLVGIGAGLYLLAAAASLLYLWVLRVPA
jgi:hypothetical protein